MWLAVLHNVPYCRAASRIGGAFCHLMWQNLDPLAIDTHLIACPHDTPLSVRKGMAVTHITAAHAVLIRLRGKPLSVFSRCRMSPCLLMHNCRVERDDSHRNDDHASPAKHFSQETVMLVPRTMLVAALCAAEPHMVVEYDFRAIHTPYALITKAPSSSSIKDAKAVSITRYYLLCLMELHLCCVWT